MSPVCLYPTAFLWYIFGRFLTLDHFGFDHFAKLSILSACVTMMTAVIITYVCTSMLICCSPLQMFLADDYELQGLCKGHCPFCRKTIDTL